MDTLSRKELSIVLLGDSITEGIGSKKINYEKPLTERLEANGIKSHIFNLARTGTTIDYGLNQINDIKRLNPDYVVIMYGAVDLQVRPNMETNKWKIMTLTPSRYKNIKGMLNPRPFMSHKPGRYLLDCCDNIYRSIWKKVVIATQGTMQYLTIEDFSSYFEKLTAELKAYNLIIISTVFTDVKLYGGGTISNYEKVNELFATASLNCESHMQYVDIYAEQKQKVNGNEWDSIFYKDHFHPNIDGYNLIADEICKCIMK